MEEAAFKGMAAVMDSAVVKQRTTLWRRELRPVLYTSLPISVCSSWDQFLGD